MKISTLLALACLALAASAQTSIQEIRECPEKAGGVYYAYPVTEADNTPAPKGYKPFYVSHYGRHGSRYLIADQDYKWVVDLMADARAKGALTPLGASVAERLDTVWEEARGRGGELTPLGRRQHHDIARRLIANYPEAFPADARVTAASTPVMRCAHSMFAFMEGLKEVQPALQIDRESSPRNLYYLNHHSPESAPYSSDKGPWRQEYEKLYRDKTQPDRLIGTLFADSTYVRRWVNPADLMWGLYWIAVDLQNMETPVSLIDIFTPEELMALWECVNFTFYSKDSCYPPSDGVFVDNAKNLLTDILLTADSYISSGSRGATLRFGHDGNITPLTALMRLPGCYTYELDPYQLYRSYCNFFVTPMASNVQIIFFRNDRTGDVICKVLHNEREVPLPDTAPIAPGSPYYRWADARATLQHLIDTPAADFVPAELRGR